jgi:hypothetical protein
LSIAVLRDNGLYGREEAMGNGSASVVFREPFSHDMIDVVASCLCKAE